MTPQIEREKHKKQQNKIYIVMGIIMYLYFVFVILHFNALRINDPRLNASEAINQAMTDVFLHPFAIFPINGTIIMWIGVLSVLGGTFLVMFLMDISLRKHDNPETVNGEAHLMNASELNRYNVNRTDPIGESASNGPNNMILSKDIKLAIDGSRTRRNCNVLVIGGSGAGKSRFFAAPNILQYNCNFVITDPSGEMLNDYGKALEDNGYAVKVFTLTDFYRGNRYNPFHYIKEEKDVFTLVETLIKNTTPPDGHAGDPFWENSEKLILSALILYLWHEADEADQTFHKVTELINLAEIDENDATAKSPLDLLFDALENEDPDNLAVQQYKAFKIGAGKTLKSILISVAVRLQSFKLADVVYLTSVDEFEFEKFADTKQALFVIIPTADTTFNFLVSLMYSQLFASLYTYVETRAAFGWEAYLDRLNILKVVQAEDANDSLRAKKEIMKFVKDVKAGTYIKKDPVKRLYKIYTKKGKQLVAWRGTKKAAIEYQERLKDIQIQRCPRKCPNHVRLILDEFANIGQIPDFNEKLATIRKYEISCSIILQAISQLKDMYKDKWNTIAANCDTKLFLGCDDTDTIEWLLKMLGKKTTTVENTSWQANGNGSTSLNKSSLELLTIDQVTMMADDECIVRVRGERPYYGKKFDLERHPNYPYSQKTAGTFEIPLSAEVSAKRQTGPLRLRKKDNLAVQKAVAGAEIEENSDLTVQKPESSSAQGNHQEQAAEDQTAIENAARKKAAKEAKEALKEMEDFDPETEDMLNMAIMKSMGLSETSPDEDIKESIESTIDLESPDLSSLTFGMT